jgi:hypothetical protein
MDAYLTRADIPLLKRSEKSAEKLVAAGLPVLQLRNMLANLTASLGVYNVYRTSRNRLEIVDAKAESIRHAKLAKNDYTDLAKRIESGIPDPKARRKIRKVLDDVHFGVIHRMRVRKDGL